ncbi:MAG TPA: peptide-modifying radical SAM enzyme CbpB [Aromatoleum sp.]|uniref:peptide-modifying radical SAM enzyme CbpB n=1 Tax=Aromatoleum sp. TaxID=2307007 RepID=UPI002B45978D|nr:peptide-modifying radical SAM enzyme CbpB [Aromatoleum sp.]HJV24345.1 peptide-modifying radical SAM enzyme CbpB [Aromatoleum sp.]
MSAAVLDKPLAPSAGRHANSGCGPSLVPLDIGHADYVAVTDPATAFWALVRKDQLAASLGDGELLRNYRERADDFARELHALRFELKPSAVYVNPTERCNLNCTYCYIPEGMRRSGQHMATDRLVDALARLKDYFATVMPADRKPRIIFHGAEPLMNQSALFEAIDQFKDDYVFGVQTNATLLDDKAIQFLAERNVSIGLSLDGPLAQTTDATRLTFSGSSVHDKVLRAMDALQGYSSWSVIATCTEKNLDQLVPLVELFHSRNVPTCMLNAVRCTLPGARTVRPDDDALAKSFIGALERTHELYRETGRKMVVANFANILLAILAPTARRLMCDISPCGGGRAFFALAPDGGLFPCSEFIGLDHFRGGNLFTDRVEDVLQTPAFRTVTERNVDRFAPCNSCAIRHFCGSPCPAEAHEMNGGMDKVGAFCGFYEEQTRYAFRLIADGKANDFLWDGWDEGVETVFDLAL